MFATNRDSSLCRLEKVMVENTVGKSVHVTPMPETTTTEVNIPDEKQKLGKKPRSARARKTKRQKREARSYPGRTLEDCVKVVEAIKTQNAGNPWPPDEIAKAI